MRRGLAASLGAKCAWRWLHRPRLAHLLPARLLSLLQPIAPPPWALRCAHGGRWPTAGRWRRCGLRGGR